MLAQLRSAEGYIAEVSRAADGSLHLIEHHCPIRSAADSCADLCAAELDLFREAFVNTLGVPLELYRTNGAVGAALGAGVGAGIFRSEREAFHGLERIEVTEPRAELSGSYQSAKEVWMQRFSGIV